jgi:ankyrin repeat protein
MRNSADVEVANVDKRTPLWYAAAYGHTNVLKALISRGAKVNSSDVHGFTPLHVAAQLGQIDCVRELIKAGAKVNVPSNEFGYAPPGVGFAYTRRLFENYLA